MQKSLKIFAAISLPVVLGFTYVNADALAIYFLRFTVTDHSSYTVRNFNVPLYDYEHDGSVLVRVSQDVLGAMETGCGTTALSFPDFFTCTGSEKTVDLYSSSGFTATFSSSNDINSDSIRKEFSFLALDLCNPEISKNGICLDIYGKGIATQNGVTGSGVYEIHTVKQVDRTWGDILSRGYWKIISTVTVSDTEISFRASTSSGYLYIQIFEGKTENSGKVCAYGSMIGIQNAEEAVCVDDAFVVIKPIV
jgi:hypothetical protein